MAGLPFRSNVQPWKYSAPMVNKYEQQEVNIGRINARFEGGPAHVSALGGSGSGGGLQGLAAGLGKWADVLEAEERDKQTIEAIKEEASFDDQVRAAMVEMSQMRGLDAEAAPAFIEESLGRIGSELIGKARGDFQKLRYEKLAAAARDNGLNSAVGHRIKEHAAYKVQEYEGSQARLDNMIMADPANAQEYTAQKQNNLRTMYPDAAPEWLAAQSDAIAAEDFQLAFDGAIAAGDMDRARAICNEAQSARPAPVHSRPVNLPKAAEPYLGLVNEAAQTYNVPANVILAVMQTESGFKAGAISDTGVKGLMQVTQATYKGLGFSGDRSNPRNSVMAGTKLLSQLHKQYGSWRDAFAAYNGGHHAVTGLRSGQWGTWAGNAAKQREIRNYAPTVMKNLAGMGDLIVSKSNSDAKEAKHIMLASLGEGPIGVGEPQADQEQVEAGNNNSTAYGGLVPRGVLMKMQNTLAKAESEQAERDLLNTYNGMRDQFSDMPLADQNLLFRAAIEEMPNHEARSKFKGLWDKDFTIAKEKQEAVDADIVFNFEASAKQENLNHSQMLEQVMALKKRGLSEEGAEKYKAQLEEGRDQETYQNKAAADNLRRMIDEGKADEVDINLYAFNEGLTTGQREDLLDYYKNSGPEGELYQARSKIESAWKFYSGKDQKDFPPDFYNQFRKAMAPGQKLTDDYVRKTVAGLLTAGERKSMWFPGYGKNLTYGQAVSDGKGDEWLPIVASEEMAAIRNEARARGINNLSDNDIRWIKRKMIGLPVPEGKLKGIM